MSRLGNAARSLASGYAAMASNTIFSLASVPLALHYLSNAECGLWTLALQATSYLLLLDAGISAAVGRYLIDYKDNKEGGDYGSVIKTGCLVLVVQGACIAVGGSLLAWFLPALCNVQQSFVFVFRVLVVGQCLLTGVFFLSRILMGLLQAHHRFDVMNYSQIGQLAVTFGVQWVTFHLGWGLYSLLAATVAGQVFWAGFNLSCVISLRLFPEKNWGQASMKVFKDVFAYGKDLFLLTLGLQLLNYSQVVIITRSEGPEAAWVWSTATKAFQLAFQFVQRIFDFSGTALGEMMVRGEQEKLRRRYGDILLLTASVAVFAAISVAVCNGSFVTVWTRGRVGWSRWNDVLMGVLILLNCVTRCQVGLSGYARQIQTMRWVYFLEGASFAVAAFALAPHFGIPGIIVVAIVADLACSGAYGFRWASKYLGVSLREIGFGWLKPARRYLLVMAPLAAAITLATLKLSPLPRLLTSSASLLVVGLSLLWRLGLTDGLRGDLKTALARLRGQ